LPEEALSVAAPSSSHAGEKSCNARQGEFRPDAVLGLVYWRPLQKRDRRLMLPSPSAEQRKTRFVVALPAQSAKAPLLRPG
jgi:hypothetical protein